jgi:Predicted permeases
MTALIYLTLFGSVLAYTAFVYAISALRTTTLSLYAYINPVVAVILGWAILREPLSATAILAMLIILGGLALVQSGPRQPPAVETVPIDPV